MAHMVETMAYAGEVPWHGLGVNVSPNLTPGKMMEVAGLDWTVEKQRIKTEGGVIIPDRYALVRSTDQKPLGLCSDKYIPIQNEQAFDFFSKFVKAGRMQMETAGALDGGKRVWGLARMKQGDFELANNDVVEGYILLAQPHVPGKAMTIMFTPIRVVCHNTLTMALRGLDANANGAFRMAHKREFDDDVKKLAADALGLSDVRMKEYKEAAQFLASRRATEDMMDRFFCDIYDPKLDLQAVTDHSLVDFKPTVQKLKEIVHLQPGANTMSPGSWWQAFNAVTYFHDHVKGNKPESRLNVSWFGMGAKNKMRALNLALEYAEESKKIRA